MAESSKVITPIYVKSTTELSEITSGEDLIKITSPSGAQSYCAVGYYDTDGALKKCILRKINILPNEPAYVTLSEMTAGDILPQRGSVKVMLLKDMDSITPLCESYTFSK